MIKLKRGGLKMEVATKLQASAFLAHGYEIDLDSVEESKPITEEQTKEKSEYKKSDIQRMNKEGLVALATELEIEFTEDVSGNILKEQIIEKLGL